MAAQSQLKAMTGRQNRPIRYSLLTTEHKNVYFMIITLTLNFCMSIVSMLLFRMTNL
jgi:hypothetical protein